MGWELVGELGILALTGALGVVVANGPALAPRDLADERFRRFGRRFGDTRTPRAPAPDAFVQRVRRHQRVALLGSVAAVVAMAIVLLAWPPPIFNVLQPATLMAAFFGTWVTRGVLAGRDAATAGRLTDAPRVARGWTPTLHDYLPAGVAFALFAAQAAFLAYFVPSAMAAQPEWTPWLTTWTIISLVFTAVGGAVALWLPRQPQLAHSALELQWCDLERATVLMGSVALGPTATLITMAAAFGEASGPLRQLVPNLAAPAMAYLAIFCVAAAWLATSARRRHAGRLWPDALATENGGQASARGVSDSRQGRGVEDQTRRCP